MVVCDSRRFSNCLLFTESFFLGGEKDTTSLCSRL